MNTSSMLPGRRLGWVIVCLLAVFVAGCRTDVDVDVTVAEDGSGTVTALVVLDREAATAAALDLAGDGLPVDDLLAAGWEIEPLEASDDGSISVSATKAFGTPDQFTAVMRELTGDQGFVGPFVLTRTKEFAEIDYVVTGSIRPAGFEPLGDAELSAALGRSLTDLATRYGATPGDVVVRVRVAVPGTVDPDVSTGTVVLESGDNVRTWTTRLDATAPTEIAIASSTRQVAALVWRGVAIVAGVLAVLVAFGHLLRVLRPERRRSKGNRRAGPSARAPAKPRPDPEISAAVIAEPASSPHDSGDPGSDDGLPAVVALDGMGVLYRQGDDINQLLVPFVRERGSEVSHDQIVARARAMSLGRITPADFWEGVGLFDDPNRLDEAYLALFQLNTGVVRFLRYLRDHGVRVACVTNDSTVWATKLRARHSLGGLIDPWIVSGAVGVRKPDRPIYEVLRRVTATPPADILVIDDDLDNLDAARAYGFRTAWFAPDAASGDARQHAILRSFDVDASVGD